MTLKQAIDRTNLLKPNTFSNDQKTDIITSAEGNIRAIINGIEGTDVPNVKYKYANDENVSLIAGSPYDDLYLFYLSAMIDFWNQEYAGYQVAMAQYNNLLSEFRKYYKPAKTPEPTQITGLWGGI